MIIKGGKIYDAVNREPYVADIKTENGKISEIAKDIKADGDTVIDASGKCVFAGLVEAHCHLALKGYALRNEASDNNDVVNSVQPQLRALDAFNPFDKTVRLARSAGVTTACAGPGSANIVGGTFITVKTYGNCVDDMVINDAAAMKCAFGENPKFRHNKTRMGIAAELRTLLFETKEYMEKKQTAAEDKKPKYNMKYEAMIPVLNGEMPLKAHAHSAHDICTALRIAKEFGIKLTVEHCTDGHLIVDKLKEAGVLVAVGPSMNTPRKPECVNKTYETAAILSNAGIPVSIITDSPILPQEELAFCAAHCVAAGMDEFEAYKAITINAARHIGAEDRVGSLEVGKDADILITTGHIFDYRTKIETVIIDGKVTDID